MKGLLMSAFNEVYLQDAKTNLAICFDYAINDCKIDQNDFLSMFLNSEYSKFFEIGHPWIVSGTSGVELARLIISKYMPNTAFIERELSMHKSKEYWALYYLAEYQWKTGRRFKDIFYRVSLSEIIDMYHPYHEMDITHFISELDRRYLERSVATKLKEQRENSNLSQSQLAKLSGVNIRNIQLYEQRVNDINKAQGITLRNLAMILHCQIEDILEPIAVSQ